MAAACRDMVGVWDADGEGGEEPVCAPCGDGVACTELMPPIPLELLSRPLAPIALPIPYCPMPIEVGTPAACCC